MKFYPDHVIDSFDKRIWNNSRAEFEVYTLLKKLNRSGYVLHSLNISHGHRKKQWAEIDFVIISKFGVLLLEVKGGRIRREEGRWLRVPRGRQGWERFENPFEQVIEAGFELAKREKLKALCITQTGRAGVRWGFGVVLSDCKTIPDSVEFPSSLGAGRDDIRSADNFEKFLARLEKHWIKEKPGRELRDQEQKQMLDVLRPNFDLYIPPGKRLSLGDDLVKEYTQEQIIRLDELRENSRIISTGGAGTGKTFIAIAEASREAADERQVLFLARNEKLISDLVAKNEHPNIDFLSYASLEARGSEDKWDVLIVDEGQDLLSEEFIEVIDSHIDGGFDKGRWRWFMDDFYQAGFYNDTDVETLEFLKGKGNTSQRLMYNCRNTKQIVKYIQLVTGAEIGKAKLRGSGEVPKSKYFHIGKEEKVLIEHINSWIDSEEIPPSEIVLLSVAKNFDEKEYENIRKLGVNCMHVKDFKGLESKCAAVCGLTGRSFMKEDVICALYTAMSRATRKLFLAIPDELKTEFSALVDRNTQKMIRGGACDGSRC